MLNGERIMAIVPVRDEAQAIATVLKDLLALEHNGIALLDGIIVVDNASKDDTAAIAKAFPVTVLYEPEPGYGAACQAGLRALTGMRGRFIPDLVIFVDGDNSCTPRDVITLCQELVAKQWDLVVGSRQLGSIDPGAMTIIQRLGTAFICRLLRWRFKVLVTDIGPLRVIRYPALQVLQMRDKRFGWTAEMQAKAYANRFLVGEIPVHARRRWGRSKISGTWRGVCLAGFDLTRAALAPYEINNIQPCERRH